MLISRRIFRAILAERDEAAELYAQALRDLEAERLARVAAERYHAEDTEGLRTRVRSEVAAHAETLEKLAATADMARMAEARHEADMAKAEEVNTIAWKAADAEKAEAARWRGIAAGLERSRRAAEAAEAAAERRAGLRVL